MIKFLSKIQLISMRYMFEELNMIQMIGVFITPILLVFIALFGPKYLRATSWGMLVFTLTTYLIKFL